MQDSSSPSTNVVPLSSRTQADQSGIKNFLSKVPLVPMDNCSGKIFHKRIKKSNIFNISDSECNKEF